MNAAESDVQCQRRTISISDCEKKGKRADHVLSGDVVFSKVSICPGTEQHISNTVKISQLTTLK